MRVVSIVKIFTKFIVIDNCKIVKFISLVKQKYAEEVKLVRE